MRLPTSLARSRWPAAALVASLLLNGFLLGMVATDSLRADAPRHGGGSNRAMSFELRRLAERLPPEAVERVKAELEPTAPALQERFERLRAVRQEINVLAAEPQPDRAAIDAKLATLRQEVSALQAEVQKATFDALLKLPPDMRARLAEDPRG